MALMRNDFKQQKKESNIKNFFPDKERFDSLFGLGMEKYNREKSMSMAYK